MIQILPSNLYEIFLCTCAVFRCQYKQKKNQTRTKFIQTRASHLLVELWDQKARSLTRSFSFQKRSTHKTGIGTSIVSRCMYMQTWMDDGQAATRREASTRRSQPLLSCSAATHVNRVSHVAAIDHNVTAQSIFSSHLISCPAPHTTLTTRANTKGFFFFCQQTAQASQLASHYPFNSGIAKQARWNWLKTQFLGKNFANKNKQ